MDGVQLPQDQSQFEEAVYFLPLSFQKFLLLILSISEELKAESTLEPPSGFEHGIPGMGIQCLNHYQLTFSLDSVIQVIILVLSLKKGNRQLIAKVNLGQTMPSHVSESYTSQFYWNVQVKQDMKVLFVWSKKGAVSINSKELNS